MKIQHKAKDKHRNVRVVDCRLGKVYLRRDAKGVPRYYIRTTTFGCGFMINLDTGMSSTEGLYTLCPDAVMTPYPASEPEGGSNDT